jgi:CRISPR-associated protein Cas2
MSREDVRRTLIAYDIPDDQRRTRLAHRLQTYGDRVQYSVFIVDVSPAKLRRLRTAIAAIIEPSLDSVLFCDLGLVATIDADRFSYLGRGRRHDSAASLVAARS